MKIQRVRIASFSDKPPGFTILSFFIIYFSITIQGIPQQTEKIKQIHYRGGQYNPGRFISHSRKQVSFNVYLPPGWTQNGKTTFPLLIFLHGMGQDETLFPQTVNAAQLNRWIQQKQIPSLVIVALRGGSGLAMQWTTDNNKTMLTSESKGELRDHCRKTFRAGMNNELISIQGYSRGASGALWLSMQFPDSFASVVANAFVSDYMVEHLKRIISDNQKKIINSGLSIRMMIGLKDIYTTKRGRRGTRFIHSHLEKLKIPHDFETIPGIGHSFPKLCHYKSPNGQKIILKELKFHAKSWILDMKEY